MSQDNSPPASPPSPTANMMRRASFAPGQKLTEMFGRTPSSGSNGAAASYPGPIAAAAANAHAHQRRRMSISTLGLSGSPNQTSPFGSGRPRNESGSSSAASSAGLDESAIDESAEAPPFSANGPPSPFSRRLSFGARAMRDARSSSGTGPQGMFSGEGFNWSDNMRSRAERGSISSPSAPSAPVFGRSFSSQKASSAAPAEAPVREMPKQPRAPDHFQERILKGDFYMD